MKTIRRDSLKKQIEAGKLEAKCTMHLTDDYKFDDANKFGKTEWKPARMRKPEFAQYTHANGAVTYYSKNDDMKEGFMNFMEHDFSDGVKAYWNDQGTITLRVHSNEWYELRVIQTK